MNPRKTPLVAAPSIDEFLGQGETHLKLESLQRTGSFKYRGAARAVRGLVAQGAQQVVTASAGNHGAGLAMAATGAGIEAIVFVPERTPENKKDRIAKLGATLQIEGADYDATEVIARKHAAAEGIAFLSAFDDDEVMAGNGGELYEEIVEQLPGVTQIVVPVGGGGLLGGMARASLAQARKGPELVGAQPSNNCAMFDSLRLGRALCQYQSMHTIAEGCEGAICERTYAAVAQAKISVALASEGAIERAVGFLYEKFGVVAEYSGAVGVAAMLEGGVERIPLGKTVVVISGGNIDDAELDKAARAYAHHHASTT